MEEAEAEGRVDVVEVIINLAPRISLKDTRVILEAVEEEEEDLAAAMTSTSLQMR